MNRIPATHRRGRGGDGADVVCVGEARDEEERGEGKQENRRRAEDEQEVAPVVHR